MNVLVDTSVWVDHFRNSNHQLVNLLKQDLAITHPMVIAELACGTPPSPRIQTLNHITWLQHSKQASLHETMTLIEREALYGLGCGLVDLVLLASTLITPNTQLWTQDKRLADLAERFSVSHQPSVH